MIKKISWLLIFCCIGLTACGQTGRLYLPEKNKPAQPAAAVKAPDPVLK